MFDDLHVNICTDLLIFIIFIKLLEDTRDVCIRHTRKTARRRIHSSFVAVVVRLSALTDRYVIFSLNRSPSPVTHPYSIFQNTLMFSSQHRYALLLHIRFGTVMGYDPYCYRQIRKSQIASNASLGLPAPNKSANTHSKT
jgi:hypothetical protein